MSYFKHSIASVSLPGTLYQKMHAIAKAGYDGIELFENDLTISNYSPADFRNIAQDLGIEIVALQPFRDFEAMPNDLFLKSLDRAEHKFDLMAKLGTNRLFVCSNCSPIAIDNLDLAAEQLHILADNACKRGYSVAYEALSWGRHVKHYYQSVEIVKRANHTELRNMLDSYHICFMGDKLDAIEQIPLDKLAFVQVADSHYFDMSAIHVGRHLRCFPGQGIFPVVEYLQNVASTGYQGYISHEIFSDEFRAANLDAIAIDGKRSLNWLESKVKAAFRNNLTNNNLPKNNLTDNILTVNNLPNNNLPNNNLTDNNLPNYNLTNNNLTDNNLPNNNLPNNNLTDNNLPNNNLPDNNLPNIEFIEFSTDFINQQNLVELLTNLGFIETYLHKNKDISLYQIGHINLVLNREKNKLSEKIENMVSAIGLAAENVSNLTNLAEKLQYNWQKGTEKLEEINMPTVKGLGKIIYYLIENELINEHFYEKEFVKTNHKKVENGIFKIDHIGHTVEADLYHSNTLFYRTLFGLRLEETVELYDPNGIMSSRVLKNENSNIRISLSATRNANTSSDYFINKLGRAGIQQIALASNDIFQTVESITKKEYILPIPANYYEDLRAKSVLSLTEIAKMQEFNILFDSNPDGSFYHFYCKELNGLFIEIVQRIGNYDRYGEVNAQLRLAAQARNR